MLVNISSNRITVYPERTNLSANSTTFGIKQFPKSSNQQKSAELSKKAQRRIRNTINWLIVCSAPRNIQVSKRQTIKNFRISFITLTLPSKQMHTHKEIKERCLNQFLTTLRQKFNVKNYVWKAELQKNGNIHFHLTIDKFIHYMQIRKYWNQCINKLGYVDAYANRMQNLSFEDYCYYEKLRGNTNMKQMKTAYNFGVSTNWQSPNSTDVKSVKHVKNFASYMAKYLTKPVADKNKTGLISDSADELKGRLWYCSQSLSALSGYKTFLTFDLRYTLQKLKEVKGVFNCWSLYSESIFFKIGKLTKELRQFIREHIFAHCIENEYPFPHVIPQF